MQRFEEFIPPLSDEERTRVRVWLEAGLSVEEILSIIINRRAAQLTKEKEL